MELPVRTHERAVDHRIDEIGWAAFLIAVGVIWLVAQRVPGYAWLIAGGAVLLLTALARYAAHRPARPFRLLAGIALLAIGAGEMLAVSVPILAVVAIAFGLALLARPLLESRQA